jgi:predicted CXXCH cytochrome family protein
MRPAAILSLLALVSGSVFLPEKGSAQTSFPHDKHALLFADCSICHQVGATGEAAFPDPSMCSACHDGTSAPPVSWQARGRTESNLRFSHTPHGFGCETCHLPDGPENLETLSRPEPEVCVGCHAPGMDHMEADDCGFCHRPVTELDQAAPPQSPSFHGEGFATAHGSAASLGQPDCNGCHTESSCLSCHDGQASPSFHPLNFLASHGPEAYGRVSDCSGCHNTEGFCRECHIGLGFRSGGALLSAPFHDDQPLWVLGHAQAARQDLESCVSCHQQTDCLACHSGKAGWGISPHGPGFDPMAIQDRNDMMCTRCHISGS